MNVVESVLNVVFLALAARHSPVAVLVGAIATAMTASKTVLYWLCDIVRFTSSLSSGVSTTD